MSGKQIAARLSDLWDVIQKVLQSDAEISDLLIVQDGIDEIIEALRKQEGINA